MLPTSNPSLENPTSEMKIWVATTPVDMRKSFDGLAEVVRRFLEDDPLSGQLFVFRNRRGHLLKVLWWDGSGLSLFYKRLEQGEFRFPHDGTRAIPISSQDLLRLIAGLRPEHA